MHWILQSNLFNEAAYQELIDTLSRLNLSYTTHTVVPFERVLVPEPVIAHSNVICMGSYSLRHIAAANQWEPGVFDLEHQHFSIQRAHWGSHMLNADSMVLPFKNVSFVGLRFIRPIHDSKIFSGGIFSDDEFTAWHHKVVTLGEDYGSSLTPDTLVQVSEPKVIYSEYRFWVVCGEIITASLYKQGRSVLYSSNVDDQYYQFVEQRIAEWQPAPAFVIDVCDTPDGIKIVEINTINSCGLYAANVPKLVMALEDAFNDSSIIPEPGTPEYKAILKTGCKAGHDSYTNEFYCGHDYKWRCDDCPVVTSKYHD